MMAFPGSNPLSPSLQKPPPTPYSTYQSSTSPQNGSAFAPPPAKRQRLSPDVRSPSNGNGNGNGNVDHTVPAVNTFGSHVWQSPAQSPHATPTAAGSPLGSFNTPQPHQSHHVQWQSQPINSSQSSQIMPPPPRPVKEEKDERITADDFGDSLFGSGINLKDEENYMHSTFNNRHHESFTTTQSTSFGASTISPVNSFNFLTQGTNVSSQGQDATFAGTMGQPLSQEDIDVQERQKRQAAANARAEGLQHHLKNQFLGGNAVRRRLEQVARNEGVLLPIRGLYVRTDADRAETRVAVNGNGTEGIVAIKPESMVEQGSQFDHLLSLLSLAANDRLRTMVDEAHALARARRYGDHGRVPPEFADIAVGEGRKRDEKVVPENLTGTQWDKIPTVASPRQDGEVVDDVDRTETPQPLSTISFAGKINARLRDLAEQDRAAEKERTKKREARKRLAENAVKTEDGMDDVPTPDTPAAEVAPKLTKKEQLKQAKAATAAQESESHTTTNQTAAMMALGRKGARYSWMSSSQMPTNRFKAGSGSGSTNPATGKPNATGGATLSRDGSGLGAQAPDWGDLREDVAGRRGIHARDFALVLERDGREKKALQRIWNKLGASS